MRAYMVYSQLQGSHEFACLVFAKTAKEAKKAAYYSTCWFDDWVDVAVRWIKDNSEIFKQADESKVANGVAHVIESPDCCVRCHLWGSPLNDKNICRSCEKESRQE